MVIKEEAFPAGEPLVDQMSSEIEMLQTLNRLHCPRIQYLTETGFVPFSRCRFMVSGYAGLPSAAFVTKLSETDLGHIYTDAMEAITFLGQHGVVHRDVSPGNIMVSHTLVDLSREKDAMPGFLTINDHPPAKDESQVAKPPRGRVQATLVDFGMACQAGKERIPGRCCGTPLLCLGEPHAGQHGHDRG